VSGPTTTVTTTTVSTTTNDRGRPVVTDAGAAGRSERGRRRGACEPRRRRCEQRPRARAGGRHAGRRYPVPQRDRPARRHGRQRVRAVPGDETSSGTGDPPHLRAGERKPRWRFAETDGTCLGDHERATSLPGLLPTGTWSGRRSRRARTSRR
jgi:hypothetical protein